MRIESSITPPEGGLELKSGSGAFTDSLKVGDTVKAEVLSSGKDSVVLKTDGGQVFKARLETDSRLSQGDKINLEVESKENGTVMLAVREEAATKEDVNRQWLGAGMADKTLEPFLQSLTQLRLPATEGQALQMRGLMEQNPGMTLEEAAFIVSNKLDGDPDLIKAAMALINTGEKADDMLMHLLALLDTSENSKYEIGDFELVTQNPGPGMRNAGLPIIAEYSGPETTNAAIPGNTAPLIPESGFTGTPLADLLKLAIAAANTAPDTVSRGEASPDSELKQIISYDDSNMQSANVENVEENSHKNVIFSQRPDPNVQDLPQQPPANTESGIRNMDFPVNINRLTPEAASGALPLTTENIPEKSTAPTDPGLRIPDPQLQDASKVLARVLADIPEFRGTPAAALERFSNMLLKIAVNNPEIMKGDAEKLKTLLDSLFTRIEKNDQNAGERLKSAREELFARLALAEEAISRAAPPARPEMLEQTGKLMDHMRMLNNIDQFAYVQLPVMIGEERKTAELYVFKKKGGKQPDPDNVNILLALDLENMGHWESLINFRHKDVSVRMEVSGEGEKEYFSNNTVLLHEMLAEAGFKLVNVNITYTGEETTPLTALASLERLTGARAGKKIDFVI